MVFRADVIVTITAYMCAQVIHHQMGEHQSDK